MTFKPWTFFLIALAGWMSREQQQAIEYLRTENLILWEKLGKKRIILNDSQRRRLATAAMKLGKDLLRQFGTLFSPDTLLAWNRKLIARKYDGSDRRGKRGPVPSKANMIRKLVLQMAQENPDWGYGHIHGEVKGLGNVRITNLEADGGGGPVLCHERLGGLLKSQFRGAASSDETWNPKGCRDRSRLQRLEMLL